jgi:dihydrodipicolinate synthase/N-acetylneuraminate lyase
MLSPSDLVGVYAIIPTPAKADADRWDAVNTVDLDETERVINALIRDGVQGLIVLGTTGECATITRDEYETFVDCTMQTVRGRIPTFVGTTQLGTHEIVYRTRFAKERGADGILLGMPMWQPLMTAMAVEFYKTISAAFPDLAIMVYGNPRAFRYPFPPEFWERVVDVAPTVMSAKFARPADLPGALAAAHGRVHFLPHESAIMKFFELSPETTKACWSTAASMGPEPALALMRALAAGDLGAARAVDADLAWAGEPMEELAHSPELFASLNIQVEKIRIDTAGYCRTGPIRPPYQVVPEEYAAIAREYGTRWKQLRPKYASAVTAK